MGKLVVFSADAMVYEDLEYMETLPNFKRYLAGAAKVKRIRTIYPTLTDPVHTSIITGTYPDRHGLISNYKFQPGTIKLPWHYFHNQVKGFDVFDAAKRAGLSTASVFWPVSGNHPSVDYLIASYYTQDKNDTVHDAFARAGSPEEVLKIIDKNREGRIEAASPSWDIFKIDCACDIITGFKPDFIAIHPVNIDTYRHQYGLFNQKVRAGIEETDQWIGRIMEAVKTAGIKEETNFILLSDHGQIDITRIININVLLADYGLIRTDDKGNFVDWDAYSHSNGASALVYLKDPDNPGLYKKTLALLRHFCEEGIYGISRVYTEPEIRSLEHLGGDFSFVLETDGYSAFGDDWVRPLIKNFDNSDYRYGAATHGYYPDRGPQPFLIAAGPDIRNGAVIEERNIVDEAPTFAKILGVEYPPCDGACIGEILNQG